MRAGLLNSRVVSLLLLSLALSVGAQYTAEQSALKLSTTRRALLERHLRIRHLEQAQPEPTSDCEVSEWEAWETECRPDGTQKRFRQIVRSPKGEGSKPCPDLVETRPCEQTVTTTVGTTSTTAATTTTTTTSTVPPPQPSSPPLPPAADHLATTSDADGEERVGTMPVWAIFLLVVFVLGMLAALFGPSKHRRAVASYARRASMVMLAAGEAVGRRRSGQPQVSNPLLRSGATAGSNADASGPGTSQASSAPGGNGGQADNEALTEQAT